MILNIYNAFLYYIYICIYFNVVTKGPLPVVSAFKWRSLP